MELFGDLPWPIGLSRSDDQQSATRRTFGIDLADELAVQGQRHQGTQLATGDDGHDGCCRHETLRRTGRPRPPHVDDDVDLGLVEVSRTGVVAIARGPEGM